MNIERAAIGYILCISTAVIVLMWQAFYQLLPVANLGGEAVTPGFLSDFGNFASGIFTPVALFAALYAIILQTREIRLQREELNLMRSEITLARVAAEQQAKYSNFQIASSLSEPYRNIVEHVEDIAKRLAPHFYEYCRKRMRLEVEEGTALITQRGQTRPIWSWEEQLDPAAESQFGSSTPQEIRTRRIELWGQVFDLDSDANVFAVDCRGLSRKPIAEYSNELIFSVIRALRRIPKMASAKHTLTDYDNFPRLGIVSIRALRGGPHKWLSARLFIWKLEEHFLSEVPEDVVKQLYSLWSVKELAPLLDRCKSKGILFWVAAITLFDRVYFAPKTKESLLYLLVESYPDYFVHDAEFELRTRH